MKRYCLALILVLALPVKAQEPTPPKADASVESWDVECRTPKGCLMFLDIGHGNPSQPDFLTITLAINKEKKDIAFISFIVPDKADKAKGLVIGFANSEKNKKGDWTMKIVEGATRVLQFEGCKEDYCTARVVRGVVPAAAEGHALKLLDHFLKHRMVLFFYWVNGERVRAATTLSGFQVQYSKVLQEKLK